MLPRWLYPLALAALLLVTPAAAEPAPDEACAARTGESATVILPAAVLEAAVGNAPGTLEAFSYDGRCVGAVTYDGTSSVALTVWGDDVMTPTAEGLLQGDGFTVTFAPDGGGAVTLQASLDREARSAYAQDAIYVATALTPGLGVPVYAVLEGAYDAPSGAMRTDLADEGWLPETHPYADAFYANTPLAYSASVSFDPEVLSTTGVVDYVLVELRTGTTPETRIDRRVGLLLRDGRVVSPDGLTPVHFGGLEGSGYYVLVRHRNHLPAMSAASVAAIGGRIAYDFTADAESAYGFDALADLGGLSALYAGDANGNGRVQNSDKFLSWWTSLGSTGYERADFNLNGRVQNSDLFLFWWTNIGRSTPLD